MPTKNDIFRVRLVDAITSVYPSVELNPDEPLTIAGLQLKFEAAGLLVAESEADAEPLLA